MDAVAALLETLGDGALVTDISAAMDGRRIGDDSPFDLTKDELPCSLPSATPPHPSGAFPCHLKEQQGFPLVAPLWFSSAAPPWFGGEHHSRHRLA